MANDKTLEIVALMKAFQAAVTEGNIDEAAEIDKRQTRLVDALDDEGQYDLLVTLTANLMETGEEETIRHMQTALGEKASLEEKLVWLENRIDVLSELSETEKDLTDPSQKAFDAVNEGRVLKGPKGMQ